MFQIRIVKKIKTPILYSEFFFENLAVYEVMWKNIVQRDRTKMTILRMRIACCVTKATNTHSDFVIFIGLHNNNGCTKTPQCYVI